MTWTVTARGEDAAAAGSGDISIASFTPAANSLLVVLSSGTTDGGITGITGHGTWSLAATALHATENTYMDIWACRVGGSPSAAGLTISRDYVFRHAVSALEISSSNGINGTTVADAFGTIGAVDEGYNPGSLSTTLAAFARASNLTLGFATMRLAYADGRYSPAAGYAELDEWANGGGNYSNATVYIDEEDTTPSITVASPAAETAFTAIEVKEAAAAGNSPIAGTTTLEFTASGDMTFGRIVGDATLAFTPAGTLTANGDLAGTAPLAFASAAGLSAPGVLAAAVSIEFVTSVNPFEGVDRATLTGTGALAGPSVVAFSGSGVFVPNQMEAQAAVAFAPTAVIQAKGALAGSSSPAFSAAGSLVTQRIFGDATVTFTGASTATAKGALAGSTTAAFVGFAHTGTQYDLIRTPVGWEPWYDALKDPEFLDIAKLEASGNVVWAAWLAGTNPAPRGSANVEVDEDLIRQEADGNASWARWAPGVNNKRSANLQINIRDALDANFSPGA